MCNLYKFTICITNLRIIKQTKGNSIYLINIYPIEFGICSLYNSLYNEILQNLLYNSHNMVKKQLLQMPIKSKTNILT